MTTNTQCLNHVGNHECPACGTGHASTHFDGCIHANIDPRDICSSLCCDDCYADECRDYDAAEAMQGWDCNPMTTFELMGVDLDLDDEDSTGDWQVIVLDRFGDRQVLDRFHHNRLT